jgi:Multiubiquitin
LKPITEGNLQRTGADHNETAAMNDHDSFTVTVNNRPVILTSHRVTGLAIKEAAIAQGVQIEPDFLLTLEAFGGQPARTIDNDETITVTQHSVFKANDGDDDS